VSGNRVAIDGTVTVVSLGTSEHARPDCSVGAGVDSTHYRRYDTSTGGCKVARVGPRWSQRVIRIEKTHLAPL